jgi:16S rRNA (adenine1518-N6/adenine1519-N6)-dimethyltransferase
VPTTNTGFSSRSDESPRQRSAIGPPLAPKDVAARLKQIGVRPSRRLGQSFLVDPFVADAEAALVDVPRGIPVVEVGPGFGILTEALLARGLGPIVTIERDSRLASHLATVFGSRVEVRTADALTAKWPAMGALVGNLPFSVATPILLRALSERIPLAVFMVQREVGERLTARPDSRSFGRLTVWVAAHGSVERFLPVPSASFFPPPSVDGVVVRFRSRQGELPVENLSHLERILRGLFGQRRKQLGNVLPRVLGARAKEAAQAAGWPVGWERLRPENLPPEAFFRLANQSKPRQ